MSQEYMSQQIPDRVKVPFTVGNHYTVTRSAAVESPPLGSVDFRQGFDEKCVIADSAVMGKAGVAPICRV